VGLELAPLHGGAHLPEVSGVESHGEGLSGESCLVDGEGG
jgi:hypothetical protein